MALVEQLRLLETPCQAAVLATISVMAATGALAVEVKNRRGLAMVIAPVVLDKEQLQENLKK